MSKLKVTTIANVADSESTDVTNVINGSAKAWVNFNGTFGTSPFTVANGGIRAAFNVSSVTDNGTGDYTINFTNAMPDANYSTIVSGNSSTAADPSTTFTPLVYGQYTTKTVTTQRIITMYGNGSSALDSASINVAIFR